MSIVLEKLVKPAENLYGRIIRVWVLVFPFFAIVDPEDLHTVLSSGKHTEKIFFYKLLHNFLGNGLITSSGNWTKKLEIPSKNKDMSRLFFIVIQKLKNGICIVASFNQHFMRILWKHFWARLSMQQMFLFNASKMDLAN